MRWQQGALTAGGSTSLLANEPRAPALGSPTCFVKQHHEYFKEKAGTDRGGPPPTCCRCPRWWRPGCLCRGARAFPLPEPCWLLGTTVPGNGPGARLLPYLLAQLTSAAHRRSNSLSKFFSYFI